MLAAGTSQDKRIPWAVAIVLATAAVLRLLGLATVPPPLNQDEASRGYDAWAIIETGADRHGQRWPLFLESFGPGDYTAALSTYLTVPFVAVLGPTPLAMRLPDALLGVLTVGVLFLWLEKQAGVVVALLAAATLALNPWHIALCRTAHESGFAPFFLALALLALHQSGLLSEPVSRALSDARPEGEGHAEGTVADGARSTARGISWGLLSGIMFGLHTWDYPATRLFTPLFLGAIVAIYFRRIVAMVRDRALRMTPIGLVLGLFVGLLPLIITACTHPEFLAARARATLLIYRGLPVGELIRAFVRNYASNLDPRYLFLSCDDMCGVFFPGVGQHLLVLTPFIIIGTVRAITGCRRRAFCRLLIAWLLLYPVPAAICVDWNPHPMRTVAAMICIPILTAVGGEWVIRLIGERGRVVRRLVTGLAALALAANVAHFANVYYRDFPLLSRAGYQTALVESMQYAARYKDRVDFILVANYANQPYIYALLYLPISPKTPAMTDMITVQGRRGFDQVLRVGSCYFFPQDLPEAVRRFQEEWARLPAEAQGLLVDVQRQGREAPGEVLARFPAGDPRSPGQIFEVCRFKAGVAPW